MASGHRRSSGLRSLSGTRVWDRNYDADQVIRAFKNAGATGVIFYDEWHDTKLTKFKTQRNLVGRTPKAWRKRGLGKLPATCREPV